MLVSLILFTASLKPQEPGKTPQPHQDLMPEAHGAISQPEPEEPQIEPNPVVVQADEKPPRNEKPVFHYPEAVRGIYVTGHSAGGERLSKLLQLVDETDLNAMVIDIKDDYGNITFKLNGTEFDEVSKPMIKDPEGLMDTLADHGIYPIARIVVFKDSMLAKKNPQYSFTQNGQLWRNDRGEAFVNPFVRDVWQYNVNIAKKAVKLGFQEIQFDYVRFPEGFEKRANQLKYEKGDSDDPVQARVAAVTEFVNYASAELRPLGVKVGVDIFGYTTTLPEAPGIGQNFLKISRQVDVISSMIYPSHWGPGYFQIPQPDREPYRLVESYVKAENEKMAQLESPPVSRPWIQDFTASWLGKDNFLVYGKNEVEAQIRALNKGGIKEFLIWNPYNTYTGGVDYTPAVQ